MVGDRRGDRDQRQRGCRTGLGDVQHQQTQPPEPELLRREERAGLERLVQTRGVKVNSQQLLFHPWQLRLDLSQAPALPLRGLKLFGEAEGN